MAEGKGGSILQGLGYALVPQTMMAVQQGREQSQQKGALEQLLGTIGQEPRGLSDISAMRNGPIQTGGFGTDTPIMMNTPNRDARLPTSAIPLPPSQFNAPTPGRFNSAQLPGETRAFERGQMGLAKAAFPNEVGAALATSLFKAPPGAKVDALGAQGALITKPDGSYEIVGAPGPKPFAPINMQRPGTNDMRLARSNQEFDALANQGYAVAGNSVPGAKEPDKSWRIIPDAEAKELGLPTGGTYKTNGSDFQVVVQPKQEKPTQGENTAAYQGRRLASALTTMGEVLKLNPGALTTLIPGDNRVSKTLRSDDENRIQSLLPEIGDALLTLGTGAAYTKEQFENQWTSNLPAVGDSDAVKADKLGRIQSLYNQAKVNAGPQGVDLPSFDSLAALYAPSKQEVGPTGLRSQAWKAGESRTIGRATVTKVE